MITFIGFVENSEGGKDALIAKGETQFGGSGFEVISLEEY